ncbi:protein terminal ear1 homolog [Solanum verrucosum]|uniref:protein terminal ear1 homolog n=1 Tax=Solanum verrucosum TaxID=315347 RepID=UPI0020D03739|nr:protein terminal ear1 homolog [Solanum verrucosum]
MADVPKSSLNPHAPEYIPITNPPPPLPTVDSPPQENVGRGRQRRNIHPTYVLLRRHQSLPVMLPTRPISPALPPLLPLPTVDSPPQENVGRGRQRRSIPPKLEGLEKLKETTVMIKNIPFHYNREKLMQFLDDYCLLENQKARDSNEENIHVFAYDFLYLPMNFKMTSSAGYGFVNFTDHRTLSNFFGHFSERAKAYPNSARSVQMVIAKIQGKNALVNRYKNTRFVCESEECLPVRFNPPRNGSRESVQVITVGKFEVIPDIPIDRF